MRQLRPSNSLCTARPGKVMAVGTVSSRQLYAQQDFPGDAALGMEVVRPPLGARSRIKPCWKSRASSVSLKISPRRNPVNMASLSMRDTSRAAKPQDLINRAACSGSRYSTTSLSFGASRW